MMGPIEAAMRARAAERRARLYGRSQPTNVLPEIERRRDAAEARQVRRKNRTMHQPTKQQLRERIAELEKENRKMSETVTAPLPALPEKTVMTAVCRHFGRTIEELVSHDRHEPLATQRQVTMWLLRELCGSSLPRIGLVLGYRDHTTVLYGCRKIDRITTTDHGAAIARHAIHLRDQLREVARGRRS